MKTGKERYWTCIVYPESAEENWEEILRETGLQIAISPLHNRDIIEATGEIKKPHYHIFIAFNGPTTYKRVCEITEEIKATIPKRILSPIGMLRYLTHKDNPEKAQYEDKDIKTLNGLEIKDFDGLTKSQETAMKRAIIDIIKENKIKYYNKLVDYFNEKGIIDMFDIVTKNPTFFNVYLTHQKKFVDENKQIVYNETVRKI